MSEIDRVKNNMLWVELPDATTADDFLKVRETLTRIGTPRKGKQFHQVCYLYHTNRRYAICHHKELKTLFGEETKPMTDADYDARDMVAYWLSEWGLLSLKDPADVEGIDEVRINNLKVIKYSEKDEWTLVPTFVFRR